MGEEGVRLCSVDHHRQEHNLTKKRKKQDDKL